MKDSEAKKQKFKAIFDMVDVDHSGTLDAAEFKQAIFRLVMKLAGDFLASEMGPEEYFSDLFGTPVLSQPDDDLSDMV